MTTQYYNLIQPTIIQLSDNENIPEHLRKHYMVNLNVTNAHITDTTTDTTNDITDNEHVLDIPRVYIVLSDDFINSQENFSKWLLSTLSDTNVFITGTENFRPGVDYYINTTLGNYLNSGTGNNALLITLPDYINGNFTLNDAWVELDKQMALYNNFNYFRLKNKLLDLSYTEDELRDLCHTFFVVLDDGAEVSDDDMLKTNNIIYKAIVKYYLNYQNDEALSNIALILNSNVSSTTTTTCGCQTLSNTPSIETSCYDRYKMAMAQWLVTMLSDVNFYIDWMYYKDAEGNYYPNSGLITELITLLENFETADYDISFTKKSIYNQACDYADNTTNKENHQIIKNYIQLLNWVLNNCIENNANKIKVLGEKFGELLPKLTL
jgi:hypothetical protein